MTDYYKSHLFIIYLFKKFKLYRLEDQELSLTSTHDELSEKWHEDVQEIRDWCKETETKLQNMDKDGDASNYDKLSERRKELQVQI